VGGGPRAPTSALPIGARAPNPTLPYRCGLTAAAAAPSFAAS